MGAYHYVLVLFHEPKVLCLIFYGTSKNVVKIGLGAGAMGRWLVFGWLRISSVYCSMQSCRKFWIPPFLPACLPCRQVLMFRRGINEHRRKASSRRCVESCFVLVGVLRTYMTCFIGMLTLSIRWITELKMGDCTTKRALFTIDERQWGQLTWDRGVAVDFLEEQPSTMVVDHGSAKN
jgi:hypothetical protein